MSVSVCPFLTPFTYDIVFWESVSLNPLLVKFTFSRGRRLNKRIRLDLS